MAISRRVVVAVLLCGGVAIQAQQPGSVPATPAPAPVRPPADSQPMPKGNNVNPDAKMVADFKARVDEYIKLRDEAAHKTLPAKTTENPAEIVAAEKQLGAALRAARASAKRGDIFTPATEAMFRRLVKPATKGADGAENRKAIKDDAPAKAEVPFKINGEYPKDAPLSTVPPDVLMALPALPKDKHVEYRFVAKHLLLYDAQANLIIDYMLNALP